jgi:GT2 family glycosyltransferase/glycosyltransferase involved in cell wall biosynthesis
MPQAVSDDRENVPPAEDREAELVRNMAGFVDAAWYRDRYADVGSAGIDPVLHFIRFGVAEKRDPNAYFDSEWYLTHNQDVAASGINPLLHYLTCGASELRNPHPRFDAAYYASEHPDAASNPLLFHVRIGAARGFATEKPLDIGAFLPSTLPPLVCPSDVCVDVVIPVYRGLEETQRCLHAVLADRAAPLGRILVVEDRSPEADLIAWLQHLAKTGVITLLRNKRNLGFVASVNRGMAEAARNDVVLLNSDTEVPKGWLRRLAAQAYAQPRVASVSPFSNNATICGYPDDRGGAMAFGHDVATLDDLCQTVNAARSIAVPTTVGFCMYIRRAALDAVGAFNAERFREGYGEENDFCLRATAKGWTHRLACDSFVYHQGQVSFGDRRDQLAQRAQALLCEDFPDYPERVARHVQRGDVTPFRFALSAGLFRKAAVPVILMVSHDLGGGVRRHIDMLVSRFHTRARMLLLEGTDRGARLSIPALPHHPTLTLPADRTDDLLTLLQSFNVSRVHIHHLIGMDLDIQQLIHDLNVPFDTTVHDYYPICPQINLLPWRHGLYCGEPDIGACNACIARSHHWARDIVTWRAEHAWIFQDAQRVFCPSKDVLQRLKRYGLAARAIYAPHEPVPSGPWPQRAVKIGRGPLRIALLGTLVDHKGSRTVEAVVEQADPARFSFHLIGSVDGALSDATRSRMQIHGRYDEAELSTIIEKVAPQIIWFPMVWPETYSYTLSAAIESGLPIVATRIGAFTERLSGRPFTWTTDIDTRAKTWIDLFEQVRASLKTPQAGNVVRAAIPDVYGSDYLTRRTRRRPRRTLPRLAIVPERFDNHFPTPCAFIRLLQPLTHPAIVGEFEVIVRDIDTIQAETADLIVTQRFATRDPRSTDALIKHASGTGAHLIYDLDDDLLRIPHNHPDAKMLRPRARLVESMLEAADTAWVSTVGLADSVAAIRRDTVVIENRLDERIWSSEPLALPLWNGPVRILCMGTATHTHDFALIDSALQRLKSEYGDRISIDVLGMTDAPDLPRAFNRIAPSPHAVRSYPGFVQWLTSIQPSWHIGLAPLLDTAFTRCKSPIKTLDYAAMGMAVLASDIDVYRGSLADGTGGCLVPNHSDAWHSAVELLIRDREGRHRLAASGIEAFRTQGTLLSHAAAWRGALQHALDRRPRQAA